MILREIKKAFTLVELIIVITVLAILATIAFTSFSEYSKKSRDVNRQTTVVNIEKGLRSFQVSTGKYPPSNDSISIQIGTRVLGEQGNFGEMATKLLGMGEVPKDPEDASKYVYLVNVDKNKFQLGTYYENSNLSQKAISSAYAKDYSKGGFRVIGDRLGVLLLSTGSAINTPLHNYYDVNTFTGINVSTFTGTLSNGMNIGELTAVVSNEESIVGTGGMIAGIDGNYRGKITLLMTECPEGWITSSIYSIPGGQSSFGFTNSGITQSFKICEFPDNRFELPVGSEIAQVECVNGFGLSSKNNVSTGNYNGAYIGNSSGIFQICVNSEKMYSIPIGTQVLMPFCSTGWKKSSSHNVAGGQGAIGCGLGSCQICEKK